MQHSRFYISQNDRAVDAAKLLFSQIIDKVIRNSKFRFLFEAASYQRNVFIFTLFISEG
jgi:hypothetical protein